jgi:hypothetical protein
MKTSAKSSLGKRKKWAKNAQPLKISPASNETPGDEDEREEEILEDFIRNSFIQGDLQSARVNERGTGSEHNPQGIMLGLLIYSYATGVFSTRQIERSTQENVAVRLLCADI